LNRLAPNDAKSEEIKIRKPSDSSDSSDSSRKVSVFTDISGSPSYNNNHENINIDKHKIEGPDRLTSSKNTDTYPHNPSEPSEITCQPCGYKTDTYWFKHHHCK
jgi:hypothetical protein